MKNIINITIVIFGLLISTISFAQVNDINGERLNIGEDNILNGNDAMNCAAIGKGNVVSNHQSIAIGVDNNVSGATAISIGNKNSIAGNNSFAIGVGNTLDYWGAMTLGHDNSVLSPRCIAIGNKVKAEVSQSPNVVIGSGFIGAEGDDSFLRNSRDNSLMIGFHSTKPTMFVGTSPNDYSHGIIDRTGKVAIGDVMPAAKLHIRSDEGEDAGIILEPKQPEANGTFIRLRDQNHSIEVDNQGAMTVRSGNTLALSALDKLSLSSDDIIEIGGTSQKVTLTGHVGINTTNDLTNYQYALTVDGGILTDRVLIKSVDEWYDAVFTDNYRLMPLNELKDFVATHHHLPEVPAENEVMEEGYDMGEMQGLLLKKIEELTLYTIQLQEQIERQQKELELQQKEIEELKAK